MFEKVVPEVNPKFKVFDPKNYKSIEEVKRDVYTWLNELNNQVAVKPDKPAAGKGVGVWGDHFNTREQLFEQSSLRNFASFNCILPSWAYHWYAKLFLNYVSYTINYRLFRPHDSEIYFFLMLFSEL